MYYASNYCEYTENFEPTHTYTFTGPCLKTGKPYSVTVSAEGLFKTNQGMTVQKAFPELSADDREFLISGYSPEGWELAFGDEDFEEEPDEDLI